MSASTVAETTETCSSPEHQILPTERPTTLFDGQQLQQPAQSQQTPGTPTSISSTTSGAGGSTFSGSAATSPSFLAEMPQWKKDLIQRRKSNVARTIAADGFTSPSLTSKGSPALKSTNSFETHTINSPTHTTNHTKVPNTNTSQTHATIAAEQQQQLQKNAKSILAKMPVTNSPTSPIKISPTSTPTKEKSEHIIGGHYTALSATTTTAPAAGRARVKSERAHLAHEDQPPADFQKPPTKSKAVPIPKQRFSTKTQTKEPQQETVDTNARTSSSNESRTTTMTAEQSAATSLTTTRLASTSSSVVETNETETKQHSPANKSGTHLKLGIESTAAVAAAAATVTTPTGAYSPLQQQIHNQSHSKNESARTSDNNGTIDATLTVNSGSSSVAGEKIQTGNIFNKFQSNQFIKNQQNFQQTTAAGKYFKHKSHSVQETSVQDPSATSGSSTGSPTKTKKANTGTTTAATATATNCAIKKKMVAVQEMKKTSHHHHVATCARQGEGIAVRRQQSQPTTETNFDPSEDLSYGPGIVSKLRCRYLSLALRESMEKDRHCLDNMRRATSLSNLLDRDEHKDNDEDGEDSGDNDNEAADIKEVKRETVSGSKLITGILKQQHREVEVHEAASVTGKKTATFQPKYVPANSYENSTTNGIIAPQTPNNNVILTTGTADASQRSRHVKRGNDSLKRARSVEALLCEKSPWNFAFNKQVSQPSTDAHPSGITIEDKINNARERLISGTDHMPPKRLTSIIDDTERPPQDLVKQTLKLFEATANRRGRGPNRNTNGRGEVATKVANYKSIIKDQKPAIIFPKPASPTKKQINSSPNKTAIKPMPPTKAKDLISSPLGRKTTAASHAVSNSPILLLDMQNSATSTPKLKEAESSPTNERTPLRSQTNANAREGLSEQTPDVVPRQNKLLTEKLISESTSAPAEVDSPMSALTKKLDKLHFEAVDKQTKPNVSSAGGSVPHWTKEFETKQIWQQSECATSPLAEPSRDNVEREGEDKFVGGDADADDKNDRHEVEIVEATTSTDLSDDECGGPSTKRVTKTALDNISKAGTTQQFKFGQHQQTVTTQSPLNGSVGGNSSSLNDPEIPNSVLQAAPGKQIGIIRPLLNTSPLVAGATTTSPHMHKPKQQHHMEALKQHSSPHTPPLTSREIQKNRINEMKKTATAEAHSEIVTAANESSASATSLLDTLISTHENSAQHEQQVLSPASAANASGLSESDSVNNSPLWALRKKRPIPPAAVAENASMVFNFINRKEVPDYIETDGVIIRSGRRVLPKPNESGFVLLGDLSLETSTDSDYDDFSKCPPSPCDVEFENANIVIDGKSSIRHKPKEQACRVQFNDSLTSTFEYPSEASLVVDDSYSEDLNDLVSRYEHLTLDELAGSPRHHHHVAVDEIIQLPTQSVSPVSSPTNVSAAAANTNMPTKSILGNTPLGSAPLGFYSPMKAPINNLFQLGVTRAPASNGHIYSTPSSNATAATNGNGSVVGVGVGSIVDIKDGLNGDNNSEQPESLEYLKPANEDLTIAYSEGTKKTDLLY